MTTSTDTLRALVKLGREATGGNWAFDPDCAEVHNGEQIFCHQSTETNGIFIAAAANARPAIEDVLKRIEELERENRNYARSELMNELAFYSEYYYAATWMDGLEKEFWLAAETGQDKMFQQDAIRNIQRLRDKAQSWPAPDDMAVSDGWLTLDEARKLWPVEPASLTSPASQSSGR